MAVAVAVAASKYEANLKGRSWIVDWSGYVTHALVVAWSVMSRPLVVAVIIPIATVVIVMFMMFSAVTGFRRGREQGKYANDRHHQECEWMCFHTPLNARSG